MFDKVYGTDKVRLEFTKTFQVTAILPLWNKDIVSFREKAKKYYRYR